jgi:2-dehydro-3-deoxyphosphogluconate aldolase/(4S)-4-hydroxy-2-oxoglutarate aldolase
MSHAYQNNLNIDNLMKLSPIIPSTEILDEYDAVPLCDALQAGGAKVIAVNIRTKAAYEALSIIKKQCPNLIVGANNIQTPDMLEAAIDAGAEFGSSPGNTDILLNAVSKKNFTFLPGVSSGSDMMRAMEYGYYFHKFCPAAYSGGINALKHFQAQFFNVKFCVSGGINDDNINDYLFMNNVECVIGAWIVRAHDIYNKKWEKITERTLFSYNNIAKTIMQKAA